MNWLIWRQHRKHFLTLGVLAILYATLVIPTGLHFWNTYQRVLNTCSQTNTCENFRVQLFQSSWENNLNPALPSGGFNLTVLLILAMPFLLAVFLGAPLIAKEYIENTNKLIWTQGVSRRKWLIVKLTWVLLGVALFAAIFATLTTWWSRTGNELYFVKFGIVPFAMQGFAPIGYAVFAVALAIALGTWLKRTLLAGALAIGILLVVQIIIPTLVRPHYKAPLTYTIPFSLETSGGRGVTQAPAPPDDNAAWIIDSALIDKDGQPLDWANPPKQCIASGPQPTTSGSRQAATAIHSMNGGPAVDLACLVSSEYKWKVVHHPSDRYWRFQLSELLLYFALAIPPLAATYWLVTKRDA